MRHGLAGSAKFTPNFDHGRTRIAPKKTYLSIEAKGADLGRERESGTPVTNDRYQQVAIIREPRKTPQRSTDGRESGPT
jgi:hypothetical protein